MKWFSGEVVEHIFKDIFVNEKYLLNEDFHLNEASKVAYDSVTLESKYTLEELVEEFKKKTLYNPKTCSKLMFCYELDEDEKKNSISLKFNKLCTSTEKEPTNEEVGKFYKGEMSLRLKTYVCSFKECSMKNVSKTKFMKAMKALKI